MASVLGVSPYICSREERQTAAARILYISSNYIHRWPTVIGGTVDQKEIN